MRIQSAKGMTLIEVMIALTVVSITMLGLVTAVLACMQQTDDDREDTMALSIARQRLQTIQSYCTSANFGNVYSFFGPNDASGAQNTADSGQAGSFDGGNSLNLTTLPNCTCQILFPVDPSVSPPSLVDKPPATAAVPNPNVSFGTPIDLTGANPIGSGTGIDTADHSTNYQILPVIIRVTWDSSTQFTRRSMDLHAILTQIYQ